MKNNTLLIVLIISFPISFADLFNRFVEIFLFFSINSDIDDEIVIATSIIAPIEPINNSGKIISSSGTVKNDISLKLIPL